MKYTRRDTYTKPQTAADILKLALAKEESSYQFYKELIAENKNSALLSLLIDLKDAELSHIRTIKNKLGK